MTKKVVEGVEGVVPLSGQMEYEREADKHPTYLPTYLGN